MDSHGFRMLATDCNAPPLGQTIAATRNGSHLARIEMAVSENIPNRLISRRLFELLGSSHNQQSVVVWCCERVAT